MGTFTAKFEKISEVGGMTSFSNYLTHIGGSGVSPALSPKEGTVTYQISSINGFSIDGGAYGPAPPGFSAIGNTLVFTTPFASIIISNAQVGNLCEATMTCNWNVLTNPAVVNIPTLSFFDDTENITDDMEFPPGLISATDLIAQCVIDASIVWTSGGNPTVIQSRWRDSSLADIILSGEYVAFTSTMDPPSGSEVEANSSVDSNDGDLITITSDPEDPDHLLLDELTIETSCGTLIIVTQTETLLQFYLPSDCSGAGVVNINIIGNGTQFSGSVTLGTLEILLTNGSGLYVITLNATHDTLYSSLRNGTTRNVKIPNPRAKTGFIGG